MTILPKSLRITRNSPTKTKGEKRYVSMTAVFMWNGATEVDQFPYPELWKGWIERYDITDEKVLALDLMMSYLLLNDRLGVLPLPLKVILLRYRRARAVDPFMEVPENDRGSPTHGEETST